VPLIELVERDKELPEVGAVGVERERLPGNLCHMDDAIHFLHHSSDFVENHLVRSSEAASGNCTAM